MDISRLAKSIYVLRNSDCPSQVIVGEPASGATPAGPVGVLLLKPSSGRIPLESITEILDRLVSRYRYTICSVAWWHARDIRSERLMSLHYPGFHRVAHGGLAALSTEAKARLVSHYGESDRAAVFNKAFAVPFDTTLARTPYDLVQDGVSAERLNQLWEMDRSAQGSAVEQVLRLDEDSFALALRLPDEAAIPGAWRDRAVILLNGFYAKLEKDFEEKGCVAIVILRGPDAAVSWDDLRAQYAGKTNPFQAPANTVRGDAARGVLAVETVSILANVIHLSANEAEGRREVEQVWWEPRRVRAVFRDGTTAT